MLTEHIAWSILFCPSNASVMLTLKKGCDILVVEKSVNKYRDELSGRRKRKCLVNRLSEYTEVVMENGIS